MHSPLSGCAANIIASVWNPAPEVILRPLGQWWSTITSEAPRRAEHFWTSGLCEDAFQCALSGTTLFYERFPHPHFSCTVKCDIGKRPEQRAAESGNPWNRSLKGMPTLREKLNMQKFTYTFSGADTWALEGMANVRLGLSLLCSHCTINF